MLILNQYMAPSSLFAIIIHRQSRVIMNLMDSYIVLNVCDMFWSRCHWKFMFPFLALGNFFFFHRHLFCSCLHVTLSSHVCLNKQLVKTVSEPFVGPKWKKRWVVCSEELHFEWSLITLTLCRRKAPPR